MAIHDAWIKQSDIRCCADMQKGESPGQRELNIVPIQLIHQYLMIRCRVRLTICEFKTYEKVIFFILNESPSYRKIRFMFLFLTKNMHIEDTQFINLKSPPPKTGQDYELDLGCCLRRFLLAHAHKNLWNIKKRQSEIDSQKNSSDRLEIEDTPNIMPADDAVKIAREGVAQLEQLLKQNQRHQLTVSILFTLLFSQFKKNILYFFLLHGIEVGCRLAFSVVLQKIFQLISEDPTPQNRRIAYLLAMTCGALWFTGQLGRHNAFYEIPILAGRIRNELIFIIYVKLSKISQYTAKTQELKKVINVLSSDFHALELKAPIFFSSLVIPFALIGIWAILFNRFGWPGSLPIIVILIMMPIQAAVGNLNGSILSRVNQTKDRRIKACNQIIKGIKLIKLYGWEIAFKKIVKSVRREQMRDYIKLGLGQSLERALGNWTSQAAGLTCFIFVHLTGYGKELTISKIFSTMELMITTRLLIYFFGFALGFYFQLKVIFGRFAQIYNIKDNKMIPIDPNTNQPVLPVDLGNDSGTGLAHHEDPSAPESRYQEEIASGDILFQNFNGFWSSNDFENPTLKSINLHFCSGGLYGITGKVGCGKSTLLSVILQQIPYYSGHFIKKGSISYVEQEPIIFSASIKDNILFGREYNQEKYDIALEKSCMDLELELLQAKDETIVGERGLPLSSNQKVRLSVARALYLESDIYLLDDPFSALDPEIANQIFERALVDLSKTKTVLFTTHQISYLYQCRKVLILENGEVIDFDSPKILKKKLDQIENEYRMQGLLEDELDKEELRVLQEIREEEFLVKKKQIQRMMTQKFPRGISLNNIQKELSITQEEELSVNFTTYFQYFLSSPSNRIIVWICLLLFLCAQGINISYYRILAEFANLENGNFAMITHFKIYWLILAILQLTFFFVMVIEYFLLSLIICNSNDAIHGKMTHGLVRSQPSYFDVTPNGRLQNSFSNDIGILDNSLMLILTDSVEGLITVIVLFLNVFSINIWFLPVGIINMVFLVWFFQYCKKVIINTKQLDMRSTLPVFQMINQMISGLIQISISDRRAKLLAEFAVAVNQSFRANLCFWMLSRSFGALISYFSILIMAIGWVLGIIQVTPETAGLYGVSVIFLIQINDTMQLNLRQLMALEGIMVSVERALAIAKLDPEKPLITDYDRANTTLMKDMKNPGNQTIWPRNPAIRFTNFSMRYRPELPLALKNISFQIKAFQKVGIVGRAGAGKSSIIQAIFRICEPEDGSFYEIGQSDALRMGIHSLRHRISVIPQSPFLFKGDIKTNLDPFGQKTDAELWKALKDTNLKEAVQQLPQKLHTDISNVAEIFSVGQKQLLCLARALLKKNKFLVLDEATSNVDIQTDHFIHNCIKTKFKKATVIAIAHRLISVADYDLVLVMSRGRIVEKDTPWRLIQKKGMFYDMVKHAGKNAEMIQKIARDSEDRRILKEKGMIPSSD